ncbi:alpha-2-macroglobulin-like protein 1 [Sceloporus undulatus]|uniref:alpha-2-macroglobulin-like protein 1 n=1 Tax=Sceloporus undulatus TaxID=8520 RepID=UPI001C4A90AD|nr:alpha-2-macroglobulin-like protein 1 [Sceloporus undulatus]
MGSAGFLWTLALFSLPALVTSDAHYMVVFPAIIHHPNTEKVCILISALPENVHLSVTLELEAQNHTLVEKDVEQPGTFECINFQVPAFVTSKMTLPGQEEALAYIYVLIQKDGNVRYEGRKKVLVQKSYPKDVIETDKPFYKPGETVRFRIVRLDAELKAINKPIPLVQLTNPMGDRIGQWLDVQTHHGIADLSFPLASELELGGYNIIVGNNPVDMKTFTVDEYELNKFEVLFDVPSVITTSDAKFNITVCGKYIYGKPVQGNVKLALERSISYIFEEAVNETLTDIENTYTGQTDKTGCTTFTIEGTDIHLLQKGYEKYILLSAEMDEQGTGMKEMKRKETYHPEKGNLLATILEEPVQNQTVYVTVDVNDIQTHIPFVTDEDGIVSFSLDTTDWKDTLVSLWARYSIENVTQVEAAWRARHEDLIWLKPFFSESNSFLEIQHVDEALPCGKAQEILVDYILDHNELDPEADHLDFYFLVISKGRIVSSGQQEVPVGKDETLKGTFSLILSTSSDMAPKAMLLLYAVFADGEVAADMETFDVDMCFRHQVMLDFSEEEELPGSRVNLKLEAAPGALCSVHAVDKSVLLKKDETLTPEKLFRSGPDESELITGRGFPYRLEDFEPYPCMAPRGASQKQKRSVRVAPWYQSEADVYSLLKLLRMKVLTNTQVKKPVSCDLPHREVTPFRGTGQKGASHHESNVVEKDSQALDSTEKKKDKKDKPRTRFPETWIWDLVPVSEEGKANHPITVPDTITEWNAHAFCVADIGFGLSQQATLRVFQPFFVDPILPYSVVRGETFELKAIVFNYLKDCIQLTVNLLETQEAEVKPCPACQFTTCLCADEAKTFSWNVTATQLGRVNFSITAEAEETQELCGNRISVTPTQGRSDTVIKSVLVKAEGVPEEKTYNAFLCSSGDPVVQEVSLQLPEDVVKDSGRATVSVIGDILGLTTQNIGHLIKLPIGCGEQNMVKFAPNIFILQYLEKTKRATPEFKKKATEFMKSGYQRELLYKHDDGSYSAFGKRDTEGNTWLTAFVAKTFHQAKPYIYVDEKHIHDAVHWLGQHQLPSGCFQSVGRIFNNALKGGVDDGLSLTAYVTASLLELHLEKNGTVVDDALLCLKGNLSSMNIFTKALSAYVFTLAGDLETREQLLRELDEKTEKRGSVFLMSTIESTAFLILAYLSGPSVSPDDISHVSKLTKALAMRESELGLFGSTQRTVLSTQALAKYAALAYQEIEDLKVVVKSGEGFQHEFHVNKMNQLVLQHTSLPEVPAQYKVEVSGNGCAYVQTALQYNSQPPKPEAFALSVRTSPEECNEDSRRHFDLNIEVSYTGQREASNMALIEVNMLSGCVPGKKTLKKLLIEPLVKKVEFENDKIVIYLDQLDNEVQNYTFSLKQEIEVLDLKAATVKVYDYYQPEDYAIVEYNAPCSTESGKKDHQ